MYALNLQIEDFHSADHIFLFCVVFVSYRFPFCKFKLQILNLSHFTNYSKLLIMKSLNTSIPLLCVRPFQEIQEKVTK